jgi:hypothetical protein
MNTKFCNVCSTDQPISNFHKQTKSKDGLQFRCKDCDKKWHHARYLKDKEKIQKQTKAWKEANKDKSEQKAKEWRKNNPDKVKKYQRITNLKKNFGISVEEYELLLESQNGVCAICKEPETFIHKATNKPARLAVDHCHKKGHVRKLLCKACNTGLGLFKDNPELLIKAAEYLKENDYGN